MVNLKSGNEVGPKSYPTCCKNVTGLWWEDKPFEKEVKPGWVMIKNVCIPIRSYWLVNIKYCPFCGKKLPKNPKKFVKKDFKKKP